MRWAWTSVPEAHRMQQVHHRGTRGGEKKRKRAYFESSDAVRADARRLFRGVPWVRVDYPDATPALVQAFAQIAANLKIRTIQPGLW